MNTSRAKAIAVTWTTDSCNAVRVHAVHNSCAVEACWHGELNKDGASLAELLLNAMKALGADDSVYIIAGGNGQGWGMADLEMPATLKSDELKSALSFELRKQTPIPQEKLLWGYRLLPKGAKDATRPVRLFYVRSEHWASWLKAADGLHHIDALLPAPVALDPVLAGESLVLPASHATEGIYEYAPGKGGRAIIPHGEDEPLSLSQAVPPKACALGPISDLDRAVQLNFASAIVLGIYGLTSCVNEDHHTMVPLPERFRARRNIPSKILAACLGFFIVALAVYSLAGNLSGYSAQLRQVDQAMRKTQAELDQLQKLVDPKYNERAALIKQELIDNTPSGPDMPSALLAVTRTVPQTHWIGDAFEWRDGNVSFRVRGDTKDLELTSKLEDSKFLGDVTERLSTMSSGVFTQRFEAVARYDTPVEAEILRAREEERRQKEAARLEKARQLLQEQEAEELEEEIEVIEEDVEDVEGVEE